ncbi:hypothetical protein MRB53_037326 [Persea americana]|nr:hypothetical protein MRB53_037326 [Persea americana]
MLTIEVRHGARISQSSMDRDPLIEMGSYKTSPCPRVSKLKLSSTSQSDILCVTSQLVYRMKTAVLLAAAAGLVNGVAVERRQASYSALLLPTSPEVYAGELSVAKMKKSYIPPSPIETQQPISGQPCDGNIFELHGQLSHYFPNPDGFGVNEYPLPAGANITQLQMLSRHGSRYPTSTSTIVSKFVNATGKLNATGPLSFLNTWTYKLGEQILTPLGRSELFDSGVLHQIQYGHLYPNNGSKIIARSTTQDRMTKSAEYFLAGFFGQEWTNNATLELILEAGTFNDSLAGYFNCINNGAAPSSAGGLNASNTWNAVYLANAQTRLQKYITGVNFTNSDLSNMQSLCAYETVALGYSAFCDLFTFEEWQGYEYSIDLDFTGTFGFQSPTGRAVGVGYVQEVRARLLHHYLTTAGGAANLTLDSNPVTFPLYQSLYVSLICLLRNTTKPRQFDFTHDVNIVSYSFNHDDSY